MVRLVFRPYTQVGRPICTSGPLRASTRVSPGFALPRHSSPSFGSYRARSCSASPEGGDEAGRRCARSPRGAGIPPRPARAGLRFHCAVGFRRAAPLTRARVRLLGPCFKTGRVGHRHRRRRLAPRRAFSFRRTRAGPRPGAAARPGGAEDSAPRRTRPRGRGAPSPGAGGEEEEEEGPRRGPHAAAAAASRTGEGAEGSLSFFRGPGKRQSRGVGAL